MKKNIKIIAVLIIGLAGAGNVFSQSLQTTSFYTKGSNYNQFEFQSDSLNAGSGIDINLLIGPTDSIPIAAEYLSVTEIYSGMPSKVNVAKLDTLTLISNRFYSLKINNLTQKPDSLNISLQDSLLTTLYTEQID